MKFSYRLLQICLMLIATTLLGCGGGGGNNGDGGVPQDNFTGIGGTGITTSGIITGFGSIFVNGFEFDIRNSQCEIDDEVFTADCQSQLALGMVVTVAGVVNGTTGTAHNIWFDDDVQGPVTSLQTSTDGLTKTFRILGLSVQIDKTGTRFDPSSTGFDFNTIAEQAVVEVSGFFDGAGVLHASFIRKLSDFSVPGSTLVELKGYVANAAPGGSTIGSSISINGVTIYIDFNTNLSELTSGVVSNGDFIEVKGIVNSDDSITALKVEFETQDIAEVSEHVSVEGLIAEFSGSLSRFKVANTIVDASNAVLDPVSLQLFNGLRVEVEGSITNGILVATHLEAHD